MRALGRCARRLRWLCVLAMASFTSCHRPDATPVKPLALAESLDAAELRPTSDAFSRTTMLRDGRATAVIVAPAASRMTWPLHVPARAEFTTAVAAVRDCPGEAAVRFSVGISDERTYEELWQAAIPGTSADSLAWTDVTVDLGAYGGTKPSLFYHPDQIAWRLIVNTRPVSPRGCIVHALWAAPRVDARAPAGY